MAAAEELEEGVEVEEKDEEALAVRRRERGDLEGIPVEGSQFGVYGRERERETTVGEDHGLLLCFVQRLVAVEERLDLAADIVEQLAA